MLVAVIVPMTASAISDAWFSYRDQRAMLNLLLALESTSAAHKIQSFLDSTKQQLGWTVQQTWTGATQSQHRFDVLRAMRQTPAIISITLVDEAGIERLHVSRVGLNREESGSDRSSDPAVVGARSAGIWYGPVTYYGGSEPYMGMAIAGNRKALGIVVAEINLKLIWHVVSEIRVGRGGQAFVLDRTGRLIAHPDMSKVLQGTDEDAAAALRKLKDEIVSANGAAITTRNMKNEPVVTTMARVPEVGWTVWVEQPQAEALALIYASLWRTGGLLIAGIVFATALAYWLARRMTGPIRLLAEAQIELAPDSSSTASKLVPGTNLKGWRPGSMKWRKNSRCRGNAPSAWRA